MNSAAKHPVKISALFFFWLILALGLAGWQPQHAAASAPAEASLAADAWWDEAWPYRLRVTVNGAGIAQVGPDFGALLDQLGLNHALLDLRSLRVVAYNTAGQPLNAIPYAETYSTLLNSAESTSGWSVNDQGRLVIDSRRYTQGNAALRVTITNTLGGYGYPGMEYHPSSTTNWSAYETFLYDIWPQVNASALDQAPDLYWFKLYNACSGSAITQGGPPLALNQWNAVSVSLNPLHTCWPPQLNLSSITRMEFHTRDNDTVNGNSGLWDAGDVLTLWMDNLRLVDQNKGSLRWQTVAGASAYYIYFDTLIHEGHPLPETNPALGAAALSGTISAPEAGGYYRLVESEKNTANLLVWSAPTEEKILKTMAAPVASAPLRIFAARGEFEAFQLVVRSPNAQNLAVSASALGAIPAPTIHRVDYVNITTLGDHFDRLGLWPDPLWPLNQGEAVAFPAGQNQPLWFTVQVPWNAPAGDYQGTVTIGASSFPYTLHVWDFSLPRTIHLNSEWGFSWSSLVQNVYRGTAGDWNCYWDVVESFKQDFINHRQIPKGVAWPAGLNWNGGVTFDCNTGKLYPDDDGDWDFATIGGRYIHGVGGFNGGYGFPVFMALGPQDNYPPDSLPDSFCGISRSGVLGSSAYQAKWEQYLSALDAYLVSDNYTNAYYHIVNEPQTDDDYTIVGQISALTRAAAPHLRQMVSEQVEAAIYNYPGAKISIWMPTITNYEPVKSQARQALGEQVWWYYLYGDNPPLPNPILMSHPGYEARLTPWLAWAERVDGLLHYATTDWSKNPWTTPNVTGRDNGDAFFFYPPRKDNTNLPSCGANGNRLVPSIRWENLRDGMEDYEYLWLLSGDPQIGSTNPSDAIAAMLVQSRTRYSHIPTELAMVREVLAQAIENPAPRQPIFLPLVRR